MVTKQFSLDDNFSIKMERDEEEKRFYLIDKVMRNEQLLAILNEFGKWVNVHPKFFQLAKKHPSAFKNNVHKPMDLQHEKTVSKQFNCFKRRFKIKIKKLTR